MTIDTSTASAFAEFVYLSCYQYIESLMKTIGLQLSPANECAYNDMDFRNKTQLIEDCLRAMNHVDLWELRELALSEGGLLQAQYRQQAWPKLVGLTNDDFVPDLVLSNSHAESPVSKRSMDENDAKWNYVGSSETKLEEKPEMMEASVDLIRRDAGRSVIFRYNNYAYDNESITPPCASERLAQVLENVVRHGNASLHYYQGLHDIAGVILHNMDYQVDPTTQILRRISHSHLRDAMRENFSNIDWFLCVLLPPLVEKVDPYVHYALQMAQVELATICLPWMITWFTHDIHHPETAGRLIDAFLSGHPLMPIYFAIALITHPILKKDLLRADCEDSASVFMAIKSMPSRLKTADKGNRASAHDQHQEYVSLQEVLEDCISIMNRMPPRSLLDLVDSGAYSRSELLRRISAISLFKAPASWSMASGGLPRSRKELDEVEGTTYCVRAKLASGVPMLMNTVSKSTVMIKKSWGSRKYLQKKKNMKMKKLVRIILGNTNSKSNSV